MQEKIEALRNRVIAPQALFIDGAFREAESGATLDVVSRRRLYTPQIDADEHRFRSAFIRVRLRHLFRVSRGTRAWVPSLASQEVGR